MNAVKAWVRNSNPLTKAVEYIVRIWYVNKTENNSTNNIVSVNKCTAKTFSQIVLILHNINWSQESNEPMYLILFLLISDRFAKFTIKSQQLLWKNIFIFLLNHIWATVQSGTFNALRFNKDFLYQNIVTNTISLKKRRLFYWFSLS